MRWKRVAVGKEAATWRNEHGAVLSFLKKNGAYFIFHSEGRSWAQDKVTLIDPSMIPFISELKTQKVKKGMEKFLRIQFLLNGIQYVVETELLKK